MEAISALKYSISSYSLIINRNRFISKPVTQKVHSKISYSISSRNSVQFWRSFKSKRNSEEVEVDETIVNVNKY